MSPSRVMPFLSLTLTKHSTEIYIDVEVAWNQPKNVDTLERCYSALHAASKAQEIILALGMFLAFPPTNPNYLFSLD